MISIENPGFQDFRDRRQLHDPPAGADRREVRGLPADAAARGRRAAAAAAAEDPQRARRRGATTCCPCRTPSSPVDVDLLGDIQRLPERERFTLILNELGAGLAGRGSDLSEVIKRANPALRELDKVLEILADENHVLAKLAVDSDQALAPFARVRGQVADFIEQANKVSQAGAATRGSLQRNLELFPSFFEQLGPALERVQHFAEQVTPTFTDLKAAAPGHRQGVHEHPGLLQELEKFFTSLGKTAKISGPGARRRSSRCSNS